MEVIAITSRTRSWRAHFDAALNQPFANPLALMARGHRQALNLRDFLGVDFQGRASDHLSLELRHEPVRDQAPQLLLRSRQQLALDDKRFDELRHVGDVILRRVANRDGGGWAAGHSGSSVGLVLTVGVIQKQRSLSPNGGGFQPPIRPSGEPERTSRMTPLKL